MRKITLTNYAKPVKSSPYKKQWLYSIGFNGKFKYFGSEKAAQTFIARMNIYLNECLVELNKYHSELYTIYRTIYLHIDLHLETEKKILEQFRQADDLFHRVIHNTVGENGNYFAFTFLANLARCHIKIADCLNFIMAGIREDATRYHVKLIQTRLESLLKSLHDFPD